MAKRIALARYEVDLSIRVHSEIILLASYMEKTRLSTKGQIVVPLSMRSSKGWSPGTEFVIEEAGDGLLLRPVRGFPLSKLNQVAGCLRSTRKAATLQEMADAVERQVRKRRDRGRY
jgi:AbrB family looped-hinge helix DNA binding protein